MIARTGRLHQQKKRPGWRLDYAQPQKALMVGAIEMYSTGARGSGSRGGASAGKAIERENSTASESTTRQGSQNGASQLKRAPCSGRVEKIMRYAVSRKVHRAVHDVDVHSVCSFSYASNS